MTIKLIQPLVGNPPITQMFGENPGFYAQWGYPGHNGVDYGIPEGTSVLAAAGGVVDRVGFETGGYGKYVRVVHGAGIWTYYAHLSEIIVANNGRVTSGQVIAKSGNTGASTGPHLHFGLRIGVSGEYRGYVDPLPYFAPISVTPPPVWQPGTTTPPIQPPLPQTPPAEAAPPAGTIKLPKALLWRARVNYPARNIRNFPSVQAGLITGSLLPGEAFASDTIAPGDGGIWVQMSDGNWVAALYNADQLLIPEAL